MADQEKLRRFLGLLQDSLSGSIDAGDDYDEAMGEASEEEMREQLKILAENWPDAFREYHAEQGLKREDAEDILLQSGLTSEQIDSLFEG